MLIFIYNLLESLFKLNLLFKIIVKY